MRVFVLLGATVASLWKTASHSASTTCESARASRRRVGFLVNVPVGTQVGGGGWHSGGVRSPIENVSVSTWNVQPFGSTSGGKLNVAAWNVTSVSVPLTPVEHVAVKTTVPLTAANAAS